MTTDNNNIPETEKASFLTDESEKEEGVSYVVPNYIETKLTKASKQKCRGIVRTINDFGISQREKLFLIYLLSLELEHRDSMLKISKAIGECQASIEAPKVIVSEDQPQQKKQILLG